MARRVACMRRREKFVASKFTALIEDEKNKLARAEFVLINVS